MAALTPMQEAIHDSTPEVRLLALATGEDAEVRRAALRHPNLRMAFRVILLQAENKPELLSPDDLDWLSQQGPIGTKLAAAHDRAPDEVLKRLVMAGQTRAVLGKKTGRGEHWLLSLARQDPALLAYLSRDYSVPWSIRRQAYKLHHNASNSASPAPTSPTLDDATVPTVDLRQKLRNRQDAPALTASVPDRLTEMASRTQKGTAKGGKRGCDPSQCRPLAC